MLHIAITCSHGFASGFLTTRLNELVKQEHLEDVATFVRIPFYELMERQDEVDIAMIFPHMEPQSNQHEEKFNIPLYIIPYKAIVGVKAADFIEDAEDILALSKGKGGLHTFPDEKNTALVGRMVSHRTMHKDNRL